MMRFEFARVSVVTTHSGSRRLCLLRAARFGGRVAPRIRAPTRPVEATAVSWCGPRKQLPNSRSRFFLPFIPLVSATLKQKRNET